MVHLRVTGNCIKRITVSNNNERVLLFEMRHYIILDQRVLPDLEVGLSFYIHIVASIISVL